MNQMTEHKHGKSSHDHAHSVIPHTHILRAVCTLPECEDFPTHNIHPEKLSSIDDLLDVTERKRLYEDLAKMARQRRDAEDFCRDWPMP